MSNIEERQRKCLHDQMFRGGRDYCGDCGKIRGDILAVKESVCEHPTRDRILAEKGDGIAQWCLQCGAFKRGQYADWVMPSNTKREWSRLRAIERDRAEWRSEAIRRGSDHNAPAEFSHIEEARADEIKNAHRTIGTLKSSLKAYKKWLEYSKQTVQHEQDLRAKQTKEHAEHVMSVTKNLEKSLEVARNRNEFLESSFAELTKEHKARRRVIYGLEKQLVETNARLFEAMTENENHRAQENAHAEKRDECDAQDSPNPAEDAEWYKARYETSQNVAEWHKSRHDIVQKVLRETRDLLDEERARVERLRTAIRSVRDSLSTAKVWDDLTTVPRAAPLESD